MIPEGRGQQPQRLTHSGGVLKGSSVQVGSHRPFLEVSPAPTLTADGRGWVDCSMDAVAAAFWVAWTWSQGGVASKHRD